MALPYNPELIPVTRRGCETLLESTDWDLDRLTADQISAIRRLYYLDSDFTVMEQIQASRSNHSPGVSTSNKMVGGS
jgi:hypothetical protein